MATQETETKPEQPTVITLDSTNSVQILSQYIELSQQKGAYLLAEAELLKRASDYLINNVPDQELNSTSSRQLLIQGIHKGQRHGAFTLNDAALLSKVVQYVQSTLQPSPPNESNATQTENTNDTSNESSDLSDLAEPIPLKPKEV
jgi:hypothetical protein